MSGLELSRGRGIAKGRTPLSPDQILAGGPKFSPVIKPPVNDNFTLLCSQLSKLDLAQPIESELVHLTKATKTQCNSANDLNNTVNVLYEFCLKNRKNAHIGALFCRSLENLEVENAKFRTYLFRKVQLDYEDRHKIFVSKSQFLMNVTFLCEIFQHVRLLDGECYSFFVEPIVQYFIMLLESRSEGGIELFAEKIPKCYADIKKHRPEDIPAILVSMRDALISENTSISSRALLLMMFEKLLYKLEPFDSITEVYYQKHVPAINTYCK